MAQLWTIIFVALVAAGFAIAHWSDCKDAKRRELWGKARRNRDDTEGGS